MRFSGYWHRLNRTVLPIYKCVLLPCIRAHHRAYISFTHLLTYIQHEIHLCVCMKEGRAEQSRTKFPLTIRERAACGFFHSIPFDFNGILCHCTFRVCCCFTSDIERKEEEVLHKLNDEKENTKSWNDFRLLLVMDVWRHVCNTASNTHTHTYTWIYVSILWIVWQCKTSFWALYFNSIWKLGNISHIKKCRFFNFLVQPTPHQPVHSYIFTHTSTRTHLFKCNADWMAVMYFIQQTNREK